MLDDARMKALDRAFDWLTERIEAGITKLMPAWHHAAQSGHGQTSFPAILHCIGKRRQHGIDQDRIGNDFGIRVTDIRFETENDDAQTNADLRRRQADTVKVPHRLFHIGDEPMQFRRVERFDRPRLLPQARIAHLKDSPDRHSRPSFQ